MTSESEDLPGEAALCIPRGFGIGAGTKQDGLLGRCVDVGCNACLYIQSPCTPASRVEAGGF
ncbi:hypothetical protein SAMN04489725_12610 [Alicyclobacillus hesperidum]|uniref:Uncharacterized protein n=1 Tax=Alicyclobacillus hesperidum TaxID=89784 RepID=A0A1H2Y0U5_9BACL|nr:hypothetical protein SAMN04489725_12610 [Alicyclobacillus hesperidum]